MKLKYSIGVDLGGTNIKLGVVRSDGKIKSKISLPTKAKRGPEFVVKQIISGVEELKKKNKVKIVGIGVGSPGSIIHKKGTVENPPNFPGWKRVHLGKLVSKGTGINVVVENDANAAAIGEMIYGAGKETKSFIMVTLGTGVGGGIIINRKIYRGERGAAGEIGHITVNYNGRRCKCGSRGCVETYIGNSYLIEDVKKNLSKRKDSKIYEIINGDSSISPKVISEAFQYGDDYAVEIIERAGSILGYGLASVVNLLDISNIVIGGGVAGFGKPLFASVKSSIIERVMIPFKENISVRRAKLRNDAGIKGAAALAFYK
ncbi:MAG: ROK family protein [Chlorobi bacterium]|nr:ROK family protein [Chlorobiota bacterium]